MTRLFAGLRDNRAVQFSLIVFIFILSFATFNIIFDAAIKNDYFKEIVAALLGTVMTGVITTMLLSSQSGVEEIKDRNVETFKKRLEYYDRFIDQAMHMLDDSKLSSQETFELRRSVYRISLISSADTMETVVSFLRAKVVGDCEYEIMDVVTAFRKELALQKLDELADADMKAVDALLMGTSNKEAMDEDQKELERIQAHIFRRIKAIDPTLDAAAVELGIPVGMNDGLGSISEFPSKMSLVLSKPYGNLDEEYAAQGWLDCSDMPKTRRGKVLKLAAELGFHEDQDEPGLPGFMINPDPDATLSADAGPDRTWTFDEIAQAIVKLEQAARPGS